MPLWMLLRNTQKWNDKLLQPKPKAAVIREGNCQSNKQQGEKEETMGEEEEERPTGKKRARQEQAEERKVLLDSAKVMAEE